jgi:hypothetical protein
MKVWAFLILAFLGNRAFAQTSKKPSIDLDSFIERLFPLQDEDLDYESIYEQLFQLFQNPININKANEESLQSSYLLSPLQIKNLIQYRNEFGDFLTVYELQAIPEFDWNTIEKLLPFITLDDSPKQPKSFFQRLKEEENAYLLFRHKRTWEMRRGFTTADTSSSGVLNSRYLGDPNEIYLRFRIQHTRDFSLGITLEKDAGEQFIWDRNTQRFGFNFLSFHLTRYEVRAWKTIALGDYQASFGQGLVFGAGYTLGKGSETVLTIRRSSLGIIPYTAAMEFGFFRGIGVTRQLKNFRLTLISSHSPQDARIATARDSLEFSSEIFTSLSQSGLHRTISELSTKGQIRVTNLGGNIQYSSYSGKWQAGSNLLYTQFSRVWIRNPNVYNQFEFTGKENFVASTYLNYLYKNFFLFGESAISKSGGTGTVLGMVTSLSKEVDFSFLWRSYSRNFHSFYSSGFSENTRPINETGAYLGIQIKPDKFWRINAYYDYFSFPWLKYRVYAPSKGHEWLVKLHYRPYKTLQTFVQIRFEEKERNLPDNGSPQLSYLIAPIKKFNGVWSLENQLTKKVFIRSRVLWSETTIQNQKSVGFMVFQDLKFDPGKWKITSRFAVFDSESYDSRIYTFENNVLWTFSIPAFTGKGIRYYLLTQYQFNEKLTAYLRFSRTNYTDREKIGSGLQTINHPHQSDTAILIRYGFR